MGSGEKGQEDWGKVRKPYYSCPDIAKAMWKDALIHKDDQDVIYWVKLEIATHQQSKTIGNLLDLPDA